MRDAVIVEAVRTARRQAQRGPVRRPPGRPVRPRAGVPGRPHGPGPRPGRRRGVGLRVPVGRADLRHRPHRGARRRLARVGPGTTVDRQCGSSQQAVHFAAAGLVAGHYDVVVAGGIESMSRVPMGSSRGGQDPMGPQFMAPLRRREPQPGHRRRDDRPALGPVAHPARRVRPPLARARRRRAGRGPLRRPDRPGRRPEGRVTQDEGVRRGGTVEALAGLKTPFQADGVVSAGNASQISDGSAALLMMTSEKATQLGMTPIARVHSVALAADDPVIMLTAPIPATKKVLDRSGLRLDEIGVFEVNEAFASVPLAWLADIGADEKVSQPGRRRHRPGPPARRLGRPDHDHDGPPHAGQRDPLRPADDVRGRRPGQRHHPRAPLTRQHRSGGLIQLRPTAPDLVAEDGLRSTP